jgi:hypothetical protein
VPLCRSLPDLGGEQLAHHRAHGSLRRQQVQAFVAAPTCIALHGCHDLALHRSRITGAVEHVARPAQDTGIMDFGGVEDISHCVFS